MSTKLNLKVDDIAVKDEETEKSVVSGKFSTDIY